MVRALPWLLVLGLPALGAPPPAPFPASAQPVGVAISGGASLGSWEAGFMYAWLEGLKARPTAQLRIVTGTSAGSANAFLSAMASCLPPNPNPLEDWGYQAWVPVGFAKLFDAARATDQALFVTDPFEAAIERVRPVWGQGLPAWCDVVFGATVTRVVPRPLTLKEGFTVPRAQETFLVRIQGRGPGRPPRLSNAVDPASPAPVPLLALLDDESPEATRANYSQLRALVLASGAFPLAFLAQELGYCLSTPGRDGVPADLRCPVQGFAEKFVDGGIFDNTPLRLAWNTADRALLLGANGRWEWSDPTAPRAPAPRAAAPSSVAGSPSTATPAPLDGAPPKAPVQGRGIRYLDVDPSSAAYPVAAASEAPTRGLLTHLLAMGSDLLASARARELSQLINERADVSQRLRIARSMLPKAGEHLSAFAGFFEEDFRRFDFQLGMADGLVELKGSGPFSALPFDFEALLESDASREGWAPTLCILSLAEPELARYQTQCQGPQRENFRVLLQVAFDVLRERCALEVKGEPAAQCLRARDGVAVPGVAQLPLEERAARKGEDAFSHFLRLLGAYRFEFRDLGLTRAQAPRGKLVMRQQLDRVVDAWAAAQDSVAERTAAMTGGRSALHGLIFSPPRHSGYLSVGNTLETGASLSPFPDAARWLQATGALALGQVETLLTERAPRLSLVLTLGPEFHLAPLSGTLVQPRLALRAGVQFNTADRFGTLTCAAADPRDCTQGVVEVVGVLTVLERLRAHVAFQAYPRLLGQTRSFFHLQFGIGYQFL